MDSRKNRVVYSIENERQGGVVISSWRSLVSTKIQKLCVLK